MRVDGAFVGPCNFGLNVRVLVVMLIVRFIGYWRIEKSDKFG